MTVNIRSALPVTVPGMRVGLLGGSFDPAHAAHLAISQQALVRFGLDRVWWLVSPGNPLKARGPAALAARLDWARVVARDPRIFVTDIEARLNTRRTIDTITALQNLCPALRFTWLMGADNLAQFHLWEDWRGIAARVPIGVLARPGSRMAARRSPAARVLWQSQLRGQAVRGLGAARPPAWAMINVPMSGQSSTRIRAQLARDGQDWTAAGPAMRHKVVGDD